MRGSPEATRTSKFCPCPSLMKSLGTGGPRNFGRRLTTLEQLTSNTLPHSRRWRLRVATTIAQLPSLKSSCVTVCVSNSDLHPGPHARRSTGSNMQNRWASSRASSSIRPVHPVIGAPDSEISRRTRSRHGENFRRRAACRTGDGAVDLVPRVQLSRIVRERRVGQRGLGAAPALAGRWADESLHGLLLALSLMFAPRTYLHRLPAQWPRAREKLVLKDIGLQAR
jgi:hypothetical protein